MNRIIPFKAEHIECMDIRDYEAGTVFQLNHIQTGLKVFEQNKTAYTVICRGVVVAIIGYYQLWQGVCELWIIPSKYIKDHALPFARILLRGLNSCALNEFHRVQIQANDDDLHNRFLRFLRFEKEGTLKKYDVHQNNFNIWARVK